MKIQNLVALVAFSLAVSAVFLLQPRAIVHARQAAPLTTRGLLGLGVQHANPHPGRAVPDPVKLGLAGARVYRFASTDFPGASFSLVFDENSTTIVGDMSFGGGSGEGGFTEHSGFYQEFSVPGSSGNLVAGINTAGEIVGVYVDLNGVTHGFLDNGGTFTNLDVATGTIEPIDINDAGTIVGFYIDGSSVSHGFLTTDNGTTYSFFDPPGSTYTQAGGINSAGVISGLWIDAASVSHGFVYSGGSFTSIDFPTATNTTAIGINDSNEIAGYYEDAASVNHGFIYSAGAFTKVDVAGASATQLTRIKNHGQISGVYIDSTSETHGLTGR